MIARRAFRPATTFTDSAMHFSDFKRERIATNGTTLNVLSAGEGSAVVPLHGWCGSSWTWRKLAPLVAADHRSKL